MARAPWRKLVFSAAGLAGLAPQSLPALEWPFARLIRPTSAEVPYEEGRPEKTPPAADAARLRVPVIEVEARPVGHGPVTLEALQDMALRHNPTLGQARANIRRFEGQVLQEGLYPNPSAGYSASEIGNEGERGQQGYFVEQEFVTANKLGLSQQVARQDVRQAMYGLRAQHLRVVTSVRREFYAVLVAERREILARELVDVASKSLRITDARLKREEGTRVDVLQAKIELETSRQTLISAENSRNAAWKRLEAVVGCPMDGCTLLGDLNEGIPDLNWDASWEEVRSRSPLLGAARAAARKAQAQVARARVEPIPNVVAQGIHNYDSATEYHVAGAQIGINVPIWNRNQGNIRTAEAQVIRACREIERIERSLKRSLANVYRDYATALGQADRYRESILPAAKETLEASQALFDAGEVSYLQLQIAQRTYTQTNLQYTEVLGELWGSIVALEGLLLTDGLAAPDTFDPE
ncbi:MAG: TolC family protein [Planctomycetaceae bacterium]|nr:TolC family protein [Planctomycetaceae bacterium]